MKTNVFIFIFIFLLFLCACNDEKLSINDVETNSNGLEETSGGLKGTDIITGKDTRAFYRFNSENLSVTRWYEQGDYLYFVNPYISYYYFNRYTTLYNKKLQRMYYRPNTNDFYTVGNAAQQAIAGVSVLSSVVWNLINGNTTVKVGGVSQKMQDTDTIMEVIFNKYNTDMYYSPEYYDVTDTTIVQGLTNQLGTKADCFNRQVPWVRYPKSLAEGTHVWRDLTAYYWLIILYDSTDVASIDTIHMHADEPLASRVYLKYNGTISDSTKWDGPYAIGIDTMFAIAGNEYQDYNKRADVFISFFPGLKSNNIFHNFGFDVGWTDKFGNKHYTYEPMNREDVRPQAKVASPGNVYRDAMGLSLDHGLQNLYEDEVIEIDKWNTKVDSTIIIKKD